MSWRILLFLLIVLPGAVYGQELSSSNYRILWDGFSFGGGETGTSTSYTIADTIGGEAAGSSTGAVYATQASFRESEPDWFTFDVYTGGASTAWTAFVNTASEHSVTVADSVFGIGDRIVVVENTGFSPSIVMGTISGVAGSVLTVDKWDGDSGISSTPSGGNDRAYRLNTAAVTFGTVAAGQENVGFGGIAVRSTVPTGYFVYMQANQSLKTTTATMTPVSDGAVSIGAEEYGVCGAGDWYAQSGDQSVVTQPRVIMSATQSTGRNYHYLPLTYKLSITGTTAAGSYAQAVYFTLTPRY